VKQVGLACRKLTQVDYVPVVAFGSVIDRMFMVWARIGSWLVVLGLLACPGCQATRLPSTSLLSATPAESERHPLVAHSAEAQGKGSASSSPTGNSPPGREEILAGGTPSHRATSLPVTRASFTTNMDGEEVPLSTPPTADEAAPGDIAQRPADERHDLPEGSASPPGEVLPSTPEEVEPPEPSGLVRRQDASIELEDVVQSVYRSFPLLESALLSRDIADGEQLAAVGNYDLQLRGAAEHGPTGYYQTYRHRIGLDQATYWGGQVFAGYRVGRGNFEPWYRERQTNDGGEFRAGILVPLARNIDIDPLRAELWRATYGRQLAEPLIQQQLILFVREATYAYWYWVGSGRILDIQQTVLQLAIDRNEGLRVRVEEGELDPPDLRDNERLIVSREALVIDATRRLEQAAYGLSLYLRDVQGVAYVPPIDRLPDFPRVMPRRPEDLDLDIRRALQNRPELRELDLVRRQLEVDLAQATNELLPAVDGVVAGSQDVGAPTSPSRDKSQFELDAGLFVDVPVQRRRARGKQRMAEGKIAQVNAKRRLAEDRVIMDIQYAHTALMAAYERIGKAAESVELAIYMAQVEQGRFDLGESDLLAVNLREQQAAEAREIEVNALLEFFGAQADLRAALALDQNPGN